MQTITRIGLDIAKSVFQVHGVDAGGEPATLNGHSHLLKSFGPDSRPSVNCRSSHCHRRPIGNLVSIETISLNSETKSGKTT
jgi:hypothetical protein